MPTAPGEQGAPGQVLYAQKDVWGQLGELTQLARAALAEPGGSRTRELMDVGDVPGDRAAGWTHQYQCSVAPKKSMRTAWGTASTSSCFKVRDLLHVCIPKSGKTV